MDTKSREQRARRHLARLPGVGGMGMRLSKERGSGDFFIVDLHYNMVMQDYSYPLPLETIEEIVEEYEKEAVA